MRKYAKKLGVLLLAFFVSNFLILNLTDLTGFVQQAKAASNEWAWSKQAAVNFCAANSENAGSIDSQTAICTAFRANYRGDGPLKNYGDQAFLDANVQLSDPKLYVSKLTWVLSEKSLFCSPVNSLIYADTTPDFPNTSNQCIEVNQSAGAAKTIPYSINQDLIKQLGFSTTTPPVPCDYVDQEVVVKHDNEENKIVVRVPVEGSRLYPIQSKYDELLALSKDKTTFDWTTLDLSVEGFTKEEAAKCMEETMAASQSAYNAAFMAVSLAAKLLLSPGPEVVKENGEPVNPFYEKLGGKIYLGSRLIGIEMLKDATIDAARAGLIAGTVAAAIIIIGAVLLSVFSGGTSLAAIGFAVGLASAPALLAFKSFAAIGAGISLLNSFYKNQIQLSGANVYNTYSQSVKPLGEGYWMMAKSSMLLATTKGEANPMRSTLISGSQDKGVIFTTATEVLDPEISGTAIFATQSVTTVNGVLAVGKNVAPFLNGEVAKRMNVLSGKLQSADRCGNEQSPGFLTSNGFMQIICVVAVATQEFSEYVLTSSLNMLAQSAGFTSRVPSTDESSDNLFDFLVPVEIRTPPETIIGSTTNDVGKIISKAHSLILTLVNFLLLLFFIAIALANILQIQISTYQISKMFPQLVIGLILANASIFVIRALMEGTSMLTEFFALGGYDINQLAQNLSNIGGADKVTFFYDQATGLVKSGLVMKQATLNLFIIAAAVVVFILAFLFVIRSIIFYFLTPLAALAFFAASVKPIEFIWKQWSKNFFNWLFMPLIASFWLWLAFQFFTVTSSTAQSAFGSILGYLFGMVCMVTAIKSSVGSLSGEAKMVMDKWQGMGKKAWGATGGAALKSGQKSVTRGAQTFAYNKNLLGVPGILERNKQREAIANQQLENSKKQYGSRDNRNNRGRAVQLARLKTESDITDAKKKKMETQAKSDDEAYRQLQRGLGKLNTYQETLEDIMKKRIKLETSYIDKAPGFMSRGRKTNVLKHAADDYHRLKADSLLMNEDIANKDLKDFNEFEDFIDGKVTFDKKDADGNVMLDKDGKVMQEKRVVNSRYLAGVVKDKNGKEVLNEKGELQWTGNKIRAAANREAANKKQIEKKDEEGRMEEAARFARASSLMARSKYAITNVEKGQGINEQEADDLRGWLTHASNYYVEGVHADLGNEYKSILAGLGESGAISSDQIEAAKGAIDNINNNLRFEEARESEIALVKRVGQMDGEYVGKKGGDLNKENDLGALKEYDTASFVKVLTGNVHELEPKYAKKAEFAHFANGQDLSSNTYEKRRVELIANQVKNLRDDEKTAGLNARQVAEAREKTRLAEEKVKKQLISDLEKIRKPDKNNPGKFKYDMGNESGRSFWATLGGPEKLEEMLKLDSGAEGSFKLEDFLNQMAGADSSARSRFTSTWKNSKGADHLAMGPRAQGMPGDIRKGGAGKEVDDYPDNNKV